MFFFFFFSSRRRHTRWNCDWSSDVCSSDLLRAGEGGVLQREVGVVKNESDKSLGENGWLRSGAITRRGGVLGFCDGGGALQAGLSRFHGEIADGLQLALIVEQKILAGKIVDGLAGRIADNHAHLDQVDANLKSGRGLHLGNFGTGVCLGLGNGLWRRRRRWFFRRSRGSGILAARYCKKKRKDNRQGNPQCAAAQRLPIKQTRAHPFPCPHSRPEKKWRTETHCRPPRAGGMH